MEINVWALVSSQKHHPSTTNPPLPPVWRPTSTDLATKALVIEEILGKLLIIYISSKSQSLRTCMSFQDYTFFFFFFRSLKKYLSFFFHIEKCT